MKLVIEHNGVKREIEGEFSLCASDRDFRILLDAIRDRIEGDSFSYGWIDVREPYKRLPNTMPLRWIDGK